MDRPLPRLATFAAATTLALLPAACGDDDVKDAQKKATDAANSVKTEAQDLKKSVDSQRDREARVRELEKAREDLSR